MSRIARNSHYLYDILCSGILLLQHKMAQNIVAIDFGLVNGRRRSVPGGMKGGYMTLLLLRRISEFIAISYYPRPESDMGIFRAHENVYSQFVQSLLHM